MAIALGATHGCAVAASGLVYCWGQNLHGQLGDGSFVSRTRATRAHIDDVRLISAGTIHTCALRSDGSVWCWGFLDWVSGLPPLITTEPVRVEGLAAPAIAIDSGNDANCARLVDGRLFCFGHNTAGELGDGTLVDRSEARTVAGLPGAVTDVAVGANHTCAVVDSTPWCWGFNLGPVTPDQYRTLPAPLSTPEPVGTIACDNASACFVSASGKVYCIGLNHAGQAGNPDTRFRFEFEQVAGVELGESGRVAVSEYHGCALSSAGAITCWGTYVGGIGGDPTPDDPWSPPTLVPGFGPGEMVATTIAVGGTWASVDLEGTVDRGTSSCTIAEDLVWCWGDNSFAQLGDGTYISRADPQPVVGP